MLSLVSSSILSLTALEVTSTSCRAEGAEKFLGEDDCHEHEREKIARKLLMHDMPHVESWDMIDGRIREDYMHRADAALDALMEPTEEMISAADEAMRHRVVTGSARIETLKVGLLAMIRAAKEGK